MGMVLFKRIGWLFFVLCGIAPFVAIVVFILLHHSYGASTDEFNWLSVISAVVGSIGAVGGIVVGMISLITLSQIDKQVALAFNDKYEEHRMRLDAQSQNWASGIKLWAQASMTVDLRSAARILDSALAVWPSAPNARIEMLERFYEPTERAHLLDMVPGRRKHLLAEDSMRSIRSGWLRSWPDDYLNECIRWYTLADAFEREGNEPKLDYIGSKIYAMSGDFPKLIDKLQNYLRSEYAVFNERDVLLWVNAAFILDNRQRLIKMLNQYPIFNQSFLNIDGVIEQINGERTKRGGLSFTGYYLAISDNIMVLPSVLQFTSLGSSWDVMRHDINSPERQTYETDDELRQKFGEITFVGPIPPEYELQN